MDKFSNVARSPVEPGSEEQPEAGTPTLPDLPPPPAIDWQAIRETYRAGVLSNVAIAHAHGITEGAIRKRAKREFWPRDLSAAVIAATRDKLARATTLDADSTRNPDGSPATTGQRRGAGASGRGRATHARRSGSDERSDDEVVADAAAVTAGVVLSHRRDIRRQRELVSLLLGQLSDVATTRETLGEMITAQVPPTHHQKRLALEKACALPQHAAIMRDLTTAQRHLVVLERQAFNIGQETQGGSLEDWLDKLDPT